MRTRGNVAQSVTGCIRGMQSSRATAASAKEFFTASEVHRLLRKADSQCYPEKGGANVTKRR